MSELLLPAEKQELSRERAIYRLRLIANANPDVFSRGDLVDFVNEYKVLQGFKDAISVLGEEDGWLHTIHRGSPKAPGRQVNATFQNPPALRGGSFLHVWELETTEEVTDESGESGEPRRVLNHQPAYGTMLSFDADGNLDFSRGVGATSFLNPGVLFTFKEGVPCEDEPETAAQIAFVVAMGAAGLVAKLEAEDISAAYAGDSTEM